MSIIPSRLPTGEDFAEFVVVGTIVGPVILSVGYVTEISLFKWVGAIYGMFGWGCLLLGISALVGEKAQEKVEDWAGKGIASKATFWVVFAIFSSMFLLGSPDVSVGPIFRGQ